MIPNDPCPQGNERIEPLLNRSIDWPRSFFPPYHEGKSGCGASTYRPTCLSCLNQKSLEKTQDTKRWSKVSASWSHSGHLDGWSIPLLASRSAVQHLLWAASQRKIYTLVEPKFSTPCCSSQKKLILKRSLICIFSWIISICLQHVCFIMWWVGQCCMWLLVLL
jgi:hypothetical protein